MQIKYVIETISKDGRRDCTVKEFDKTEIIIGRGSASDILFTSRQVSFKHARLRLIEGKIFVEDLGSSSGIRINDQIVSRAFLKPGDILKVGDVSLKVTFWDEVWKEGDETLKGTFENDVWELIETRKEEKREEEKPPAPRASDKFEITSLPSYKVISLALIVPILLFFLVAPLMGVNEISWSSGPIS
ncbi:MAG: FHA domain-containing protein, partial [Nitrospinales bacterium]